VGCPHGGAALTPHPSPPPGRGHFVTFITYPDFKRERQDPYELFGEVKRRSNGLSWYAEQEFYPTDLFTVAAIGDGGDTALTLDLEREWKNKKLSGQKPRP
jgi:hypothetical protein